MSKTLLELCIREEQEIQFTTFSHGDALELGLKILNESQSYEGPIAIEITINDLQVFQYYPDGTGAFHKMWLERKRNMVKTKEISSLHAFAELESDNESMEKDWLLSPKKFAACGGGFPIRIKGGSVIGSIGVSGLSHLLDHEILMKGVKAFFNGKGLKTL